MWYFPKDLPNISKPLRLLSLLLSGFEYIKARKEEATKNGLLYHLEQVLWKFVKKFSINVFIGGSIFR